MDDVDKTFGVERELWRPQRALTPIVASRTWTQ